MAELDRQQAEELATTILELPEGEFLAVLSSIEDQLRETLGDVPGDWVCQLVRYSQAKALRAIVGMLATHEAHVMARVEERLGRIEEASAEGLAALEALGRDSGSVP